MKNRQSTARTHAEPVLSAASATGFKPPSARSAASRAFSGRKPEPDLLAIGLSSSAFERMAVLTGKPRPTLDDLRAWFAARKTQSPDHPEMFQPYPSCRSADTEIERFAAGHGHDDPALLFLGMNIRAHNFLSTVICSKILCLSDLAWLFASHPDRDERADWIQHHHGGNATVRSIENFARWHLTKEMMECPVLGRGPRQLVKMGLNAAAVGRIAYITGKPQPGLEDLRYWFSHRPPVSERDFDLNPAYKTDRGIEAFAIANGITKPSLRYLGVKARAIAVLRMALERDRSERGGPSGHLTLADLRHAFRAHPDPASRRAWLLERPLDHPYRAIDELESVARSHGIGPKR